MIKTRIIDGHGDRYQAKVSHIGQVITGPYDYNLIKYINLDVAAQGYTFFPNRAGEQFVLTGLVIVTNKNVVTDCIVDIYESAAINSATIGTSLFQLEMLKNSTLVLLPLNILCSEGVYINGKTDDDDVYVTMMGYYIPAV